MPLPAAISNKLRCWSFYLYPCYRGTGARLKYIAPDWSEVDRTYTIDLLNSSGAVCAAVEKVIYIRRR
jgi:hypothetical protein